MLIFPWAFRFANEVNGYGNLDGRSLLHVTTLTNRHPLPSRQFGDVPGMAAKQSRGVSAAKEPRPFLSCGLTPLFGEKVQHQGHRVFSHVRFEVASCRTGPPLFPGPYGAQLGAIEIDDVSATRVPRLPTCPERQRGPQTCVG